MDNIKKLFISLISDIDDYNNRGIKYQQAHSIWVEYNPHHTIEMWHSFVLQNRELWE